MARHRSPRGRSAHRTPSPQAFGTVAGHASGHRAPSSTPLRRGAVAVTGGALTIAGVAAVVPLAGSAAALDPTVVTAASVLTVDAPQPAGPAAEPAASGPDASGPTVSEPTATSTPVRVPVVVDLPTPGRQLDTDKLVKAVQLGERAVAVPTAPGGPAVADPANPANPDRATPGAPAAAPKRAPSTCDLDTSDLGAVKSHVRVAANFLGCRFGEPTVYGVAGRGGPSDHPAGKALDFMVDKATGNSLAACALRDQDELGVSYVIWRQRINFGSGWKPMEDRGGATANHMDHVHVSFESGAKGRPLSC